MATHYLLTKCAELRVAVLRRSEDSGGSRSLRKHLCGRVVLLFRHVVQQAHLNVIMYKYGELFDG